MILLPLMKREKHRRSKMRKDLKVSVQGILKDGMKIEEYLESIPVLIDELESSMGRLAQCWEGQAWIQYQNNVAIYVEILTDIYQCMGKYVEDINESAKIYQRAEQDVCTTLDHLLVL